LIFLGITRSKVHRENPPSNGGFSRYHNYMISRTHLQNTIQRKLEANRVVALIGPRQCGKTTLARQFVPPTSANYFDLEDPFSLARLDQPMTALQDSQGLVVLDEIQRRPELFPVL
jgi:predicted AAA+ superfamily ATPase